MVRAVCTSFVPCGLIAGGGGAGGGGGGGAGLLKKPIMLLLFVQTDYNPLQRIAAGFLRFLSFL